MPDKGREEFVTTLFLQYYNSITDKQYENLGRPEDVGVSGTYEFLCKEKNSTSDYLVIEEKSLNASTENVRDIIEIGEIVTEVHRILKEKGLSYNKRYYFNLEFRNAPCKRERITYTQKIAESVQEAINQNIDADFHNKVALNVRGCDLIEKLYLFKTDKGEGVYFYFAPDKNFSEDVQTNVDFAVCQILQNANEKLETPHEEGKNTILLITNMVTIFHVWHIKETMQCIKEESHNNIDEIFYINQKSLEPGYAIDKIK